MLKAIRRLISDTAVYGIGSALERLIGFLLLPLYTKFLTVGDYGTMAMLMIVSSVFRPLATLGMANSIFRYITQYNEGHERKTVLSVGLISVLVSSLILCIFGLWFARPISVLLIGDSALVLLIRLTLVLAMIGAIGDIPRVVLRAERRVKIVISLNCIMLLVSIPVTIWLVVVEQLGVLGVVVGWLAGEGVVTIISLVFTIRELHLAFDIVKLKQMLAYGAPFVPHRLLAVAMVYFGVYVVRNMLGIDDAGLYSMAIMLTAPLTLLVGTVQRAWVPLKFQIHSEENNPERIFSSIVTYYVAVILYLLVGIAAWAPELLRIFTEESFHRAAALIPVVALIPISSGIYWMIGTGFEKSATNKTPQSSPIIFNTEPFLRKIINRTTHDHPTCCCGYTRTECAHPRNQN